MKKKLIITIAAIVALLVLIFVLVLVLGSSKKIDVNDPDSLYEYTMTQKGDAVTLRINGEFPEGYLWKCEEDHPGVVSVEEKKNTKKKAEFVITPSAEGAVVLTLGLEKDNVLPDRVFEITAAFTVGSDNSLSSVGTTHTELPGFKLFGDGTAHHYGFAQNSDGTVSLYLGEAGEDGFITVFDGDPSAAVTSATVEDGVCKYVVSPRREGTCTLKVCTESEKTAVELSLSTDGKGMLTVTDHKVVDYEYITADPDDEITDTETVLGKISLPDGAATGTGNIRILVDDNDKVYSVGWLDFTVGETAWRYFTAPTGPVELLYNFYSVNREALKEVTVGENSGFSYNADGVNLVTWTNTDGNLFAVCTADTAADAAGMANTLFAANPVSNVAADADALPND